MVHNNYYKGKIVPDIKNTDRDLSCMNSHCHGISCFDCILYPSGLVQEILRDYDLKEKVDRYDEK